MRREEWDFPDFPPTQLVKARRGEAGRGLARPGTARQGKDYSGRYRYRSRFDVYQPNGWDWPIRKKIINIWWRVMIVSIKVLLTIALTIMAFGGSWLFWTVITL
jgi:hypothetical protein